MNPSISSCLALAALACSLPSQALVNNGSLTQTNASGFLLPQNSDLPPGWSIASGTPDVLTPTANSGIGGTPFPIAGVDFSPDGGTWVGLGRDDNASFLEAMSQTLSGLVVGQTYRVSWFAANFGAAARGSNVPAYRADNAFQVQLDGQRAGAGGLLSQGPEWHAQSLQFTALASDIVLRFQLDRPERAYLSIDGIAVTAVPEPAVWLMMAVGLVAIARVPGRGDPTRRDALRRA